MNYLKISGLSVLLSAVLSAVLSTVLWAQSEYFKQFVEPIETQLERELNSPHTLEKVYEINEFVGSTKVSTYPLEDPYGSLEGYVLFAARSEAVNWVFGFYKNGVIEWYTTEALQCSDIKVYGSMDLNLDGRVDILVNCALFGRPNFRGFMYIYSWDGTQSELISNLEITDWGFSQSEIEAYEADSFGLVDLDGDGTIEIEGLASIDPDTWKYWSWNGEVYGDWSTTPAPPSDGYYPANMAEGEVNAQVAKTDTGFIYKYTVISYPSSKRRIVALHLDHGKQESVGKAPKGWKFYGAGRSEYPITWIYSGSGTYGMISPGDSLSTLVLFSTSPPSIYSRYLRSEHRLPDYDNPNYSFLGSLIDIRTNSDKGSTLAPSPDLVDYTPIELVDSLYKYLNLSCTELEWAADATVCGELEDELTEVKTSLQAGDSLSAANALANFIELVEAEKDGSLTSEGYALLYFNAEYLRRRLEKENE